MIEALARIRSDSVLSRRSDKPSRGRSVLQRSLERARSLPPRLYIGAALAALLAGIGVNALLLQRERHPAPLFAPPPQQRTVAPATLPPAPPAAPAAAPPPGAPTMAPAPPPAPAPLRSAPGEAGSARPADPIADLLRGEPGADNSRLLLAAQTALARLGYPVKADGARGGATDQALKAFERDHGLPVSTEITPRLVKQLNAAARAGAH